MARNTSGLKRTAGPGRPKGSANKIPAGFKASFRAAYEAVLSKDPALIEKAIEKGLKGKPRESFAYAQLIAYYADGKPVEKLQVNTPVPVTVINKFYGIEPSDVDD